MSAARIAARAALLVVAFGIVAMHHLVGGAGHCSGTPAEHPMAMTVVVADPPEHAGVTAGPADQQQDAAWGHPCLAVVAAAGGLLALVPLAVLGVLPVPGRAGPRAPTSRQSRAPPPVRRRLAELQVLRT